MRRAAVWFLLLVKRQARTILFWCSACLFVLILWMVSEVSIPGGTNWEVLVWNEDTTTQETANFTDTAQGAGTRSSGNTSPDPSSNASSGTSSSASSGTSSSASSGTSSSASHGALSTITGPDIQSDTGSYLNGTLLVESLLESDSAYHFQEADSREDLIRRVETGEAECGFIIEEGFGQKLAEGDIKDLITCVQSSFTTKGAGAKETVFSVIYKWWAGKLLTDERTVLFEQNGRENFSIEDEKDTDDFSNKDENGKENSDEDKKGTGNFSDKDKEGSGNFSNEEDAQLQQDEEDTRLQQSLEEKYAQYLDSDEVFRVNYHPISTKETVLSAVNNASSKGRQPVRAMAMILIFLGMLLLGRSHLRDITSVPGKAFPWEALTPGKRFQWEFTDNIAGVSIPAAAAFAAVRILETNRTAWWRELLCFLLMIVLADLWVIGFGRIFRSAGTYVTWVFTILVIEMVLCPIFWNPGTYLPILSILGCLFPPGLPLLLAV